MRDKKKKYLIAAVLLAGGTGRRMGGKLKQFMKIGGRRVVSYSLDKFIRCPFIDTIVVVVPVEKVGYAEKIIKRDFDDPRIRIIAGGKTRRESSYAALRYLRRLDLSTDYVIIHDVARPFISVAMIRSVVEEAKRCGAAILGMVSLETVAEAENGFLRKVPQRENTYYTFTPHCFRFDWIWDAHRAAPYSTGGRSCHDLELLSRSGRKIKIIDVSPPTMKYNPNIKITYPPDEKILETFIRHAVGSRR